MSSDILILRDEVRSGGLRTARSGWTRLLVVPALVWIFFTLLTWPVFTAAGGLGLAPLGFGLGLAGWLTFKPSNSDIRVFYAALMLALGFAWVAQIWSQSAALWTFSNAVKIMVIGLCAALAPKAADWIAGMDRRIIINLVLAGGVFALGFLCLDIMSGYGLNILFDPVRDGQILAERQIDAEKNLGRGLLILLPLLPVLGALYVQSYTRIWPVLAAGAILFLTAYLNRSSLLLPGIVLVTFAAWAAHQWPRLSLKLMGAVAVLSILCAPLIGVLAKPIESRIDLPLSWDHRLKMWAYTTERIKEAPGLGHGFDASRTFQDSYEVWEGYDLAYISLHPHNIGQQIWLELGLIGALLFALVIICLIRPLLNFARAPMQAAALCGFIAAHWMIAMTSIGAWQFWWWGAMGFGAFLMCALLDTPKRSLS